MSGNFLDISLRVDTDTGVSCKLMGPGWLRCTNVHTLIGFDSGCCDRGLNIFIMGGITPLSSDSNVCGQQQRVKSILIVRFFILHRTNSIPYTSFKKTSLFLQQKPFTLLLVVFALLKNCTLFTCCWRFRPPIIYNYSITAKKSVPSLFQFKSIHL